MSSDSNTLKLFKRGESLTQKEVAARLGITVSGASRTLRRLYERGQLQIIQKPGMSMRYQLPASPDILRSPNGNPLYFLYEPQVKLPLISDKLVEIAKFLTTWVLTVREEELEDCRDILKEELMPLMKNILLLSEILRDATPEQIRATLKAYEKEKVSES